MNNEVIAILISIIMVCIVIYQSRQQYKQFNQQMKEQSEIEVFKILTIKGNKISDFYEVIYNKVTKKHLDYDEADIFKMHTMCSQFVKSVLIYDKHITSTRIKAILSDYVKSLFSNKRICSFLLIDHLPDDPWKKDYMTLKTKGQELSFKLYDDYKKNTYDKNMHGIYKDFFIKYFTTEEMPELVIKAFHLNKK